jgi:uncharacterized protein (DUF1697 family)
VAPKRLIALLRGINLGSRRRLAMSDLRDLLDGLGYDEVKTLLQSGNAVFTTDRGADTCAREISSRIQRDLGMKVAVMVFSAADLRAVVSANPFAKKGTDPKHLHVAFLSAAVPRNKLAQIDRNEIEPDDFAAGKRVIYELRPNGVLGSRLPDWQKVLGVDATARNWNTVTKLDALPR